MTQNHPWLTFIAFELAPISAVLTAEHVVRRIAAHCACVDERGAFGVRPGAGGGDPAA